MIRGIGVDMVKIADVAQLSEGIGQGGLARMFTAREVMAAGAAHNRAEYFAARFAAKEAVFKAVAPLLQDHYYFDLRIVETLNRADGSPYVNVTGKLKPILEQANVQKLHISITTEGEYAAAFVIAE